MAIEITRMRADHRSATPNGHSSDSTSNGNVTSDDLGYTARDEGLIRDDLQESVTLIGVGILGTAVGLALRSPAVAGISLAGALIGSFYVAKDF